MNRPQTHSEFEQRGASTWIAEHTYSWLTSSELERLRAAVAHRFPHLPTHERARRVEEMACQPLEALDFIEGSESQRHD